MSWWDDWGPALPVEGGLVVAAPRRGAGTGSDGRSVGAEIVRRVVERVNPGVATRGRAYARGGQTVTMTIEPGRLHATVQGSQTAPYSVTIACSVPEARRRRLVAAFEHGLADPSAGIPARGTPALRDEIDACALLDDVPITAKCTCPYGAVCKHCVALAYLAADRLDGSPIAIATFLGVRDEDLGSRESTTAPSGAGPTFPASRHAQLARSLERLDRRTPPTIDDVLGRAERVLRPSDVVARQLGVDRVPPGD